MTQERRNRSKHHDHDGSSQKAGGEKRDANKGGSLASATLSLMQLAGKKIF